MKRNPGDAAAGGGGCAEQGLSDFPKSPRSRRCGLINDGKVNHVRIVVNLIVCLIPEESHISQQVHRAQRFGYLMW